MISAIVPAYNSESTLHKCVESILCQTFTDLEVIIIDDGSSDATWNVARELESQDSRVRAFHYPNAGALKARLKGVSKARGEWITFVDSDDTITPKALEMLSSLVTDDRDIVCGTLNINNTGFTQHKVQGELSSKVYTEAILLDHTYIGPNARLYRSILFEGIEKMLEPYSSIKQNEDMLMLLAVTQRARRIFLDPDVICYNYIFRLGSMSRQTTPTKMWMLLFEAVTNLLPSDGTMAEPLAEFYIDRIYLNCLLKGLDVTVFENLVKQTRSVLTKANSKAIADLLLNPRKRKWHYRRHASIQLLKRIIKRLIGRNQL